jgi:hypothetical protein
VQLQDEVFQYAFFKSGHGEILPIRLKNLNFVF